MRNKKSKTILYAAIVIVVLGFIFVATRKLEPASQIVEQPLENNFTNQ